MLLYYLPLQLMCTNICHLKSCGNILNQDDADDVDSDDDYKDETSLLNRCLESYPFSMYAKLS